MRTTQKFQPHGVLPQIFNRSCSQICCPVSGGAYQDIREVTTEWNDARNIGACLNSEAECTKRIPKRPFLPYLFPRKGKDRAAGGASETTTTERILASKASYPLCSFLPFQTANSICGLGFSCKSATAIPQSLSAPAPFTQGSLGSAQFFALPYEGKVARRSRDG